MKTTKAKRKHIDDERFKSSAGSIGIRNHEIFSATDKDSSFSSACSNELEYESDDEIHCDVPGSFASCIGLHPEMIQSKTLLQSMPLMISGELSIVHEGEENPSDCEESINSLENDHDDNIILKEEKEMTLTENLSFDTTDTSYTKSLSLHSLESNNRTINCFEDKKDFENELASRLEVICSLKEIILSQRKTIKKLKKQKQRLKLKLEKTE